MAITWDREEETEESDYFDNDENHRENDAPDSRSVAIIRRAYIVKNFN